MSTEQLLRDPNITPTSEVIANHLGSANSAYTKLLDVLILMDFRKMLK